MSTKLTRPTLYVQNRGNLAVTSPPFRGAVLLLVIHYIKLAVSSLEPSAPSGQHL